MSPMAVTRASRRDQVFRSAAAHRNSRSGFANRWPVRAASSFSPWTVIVISAAIRPVCHPRPGWPFAATRWPAHEAGPEDGCMEQNTNTDLRTFVIGGDLPVRRIGFGAMRLAQGTFGGPVRPAADGLAVLRRAIELGV